MVYLTGNKGMLGRSIEKLLIAHAIPYYTSDIETDICSKEQLYQFNASRFPKWMINCAAYTAVDKAEEAGEEKALSVNSLGAGNIAELAVKKRARFIHISTDYVFDGLKNAPYLPDDTVHPLSRYGKSKADGEALVISQNPHSIIIRTAWLYGMHGNNFADKMLELFKKFNQVRVVNDQFGSPTFCEDLAALIIHIVKNDYTHKGIYHFTNSGQTTWHHFACEIYDIAAKAGFIDKPVEIIPIETKDYPVKAVRPAYTVLDTQKTEKDFCCSIRDWKLALFEYLKNRFSQ